MDLARHPQLRVGQTPILDLRSPEQFFDCTLRGLLAEHRELARALGGRFGFVVGAIERIIDLDNGRVRGDAHSHVVQDDDALNAVAYVSEAAFADMMRGQRDAKPYVRARDPEAMQPLLQFFLAVSR